MYDIENIYQPRSVEEALQALASHPQALVVAGGTDVLLQIRSRELAGCSLVSIHDLPELDYVREGDGVLEIGSLTTFQQLESHPLLREKLPLLAEAAGQMSGPQIRRMATVGGNVCRGLTSGDAAPALFCYNAQAILLSAAGERRLPLDQFYLGLGKTALAPGELLIGLAIAEADWRGYAHGYCKFAIRQAMDIGLVNTALLAKLSPDKQSLAELRLAFGAVGPAPMRMPRVEQALAGKPLAEARAAIAALVREDTQPFGDWRASRELRWQVLGECAKRCLTQAIAAAGGQY